MGLVCAQVKLNAGAGLALVAEFRLEDKPACGQFNECQIVYVLALASPTHPIKPEAYWQGWESQYYVSNRTEFGIPLEAGERSRCGYRRCS